MEDDATPPVLTSMPFEVLVGIASCLVPLDGLADSPAAWGNAIKLASASRLTSAVVLEAVRASVPVAVGDADLNAARLCARIGTLLAGGGCSQWRLVRPLRAVRAQHMHAAPLQSPPKLSGASLCTVARGQLCLFGGRVSTSGDTLDATHLATIRPGVAIWDTLLPSELSPPARCYHSACTWEEAPSQRTRRVGDPHPMIVFGGAGEGEGGHESLLNDVWCASFSMPPTPGGATKATSAGDLNGKPPMPPFLNWHQLHPSGEPPVARSSHICSRWAAGGALVVHGVRCRHAQAPVN